MSGIFLSHSNENRHEAAALGDWCKEIGWDKVLTSFTSGDDQQPERGKRAFRDELAPCEAVLCLVSRAWLASEPGQAEFALARKRNKNIFCALIEAVPIDELPSYITQCDQKVFLVADADKRRFHVASGADAEEREVEFSAEALDQLKDLLTPARVAPLSFDWPPQDEPRRAPYRGLEPLQAIDAGIFFGRDEALTDALDALRGMAEGPARFFTIIGASGAGKSSFLHAGLWPRLARDRRFVTLPVLRPAGAPISGARGMAAALASAAESRGLETTAAEIREAVAGGAETAAPLLKRLAKTAVRENAGETSSTVIVAIDQAEELLRPEGALENQSLLTLLAELAKREEISLIVIFAARVDFYAELQRAKALEGFRHEIFALPAMSRDACRRVIEGPLERLAQAGRTFDIEPELTQALLADIDRAGPDSLPLLAFTLAQLYRACRQEKRITRADYEKFGKLEGSIDAAAARILATAGAGPGFPKEREARLALLRRGLIPRLACIDPQSGAARRRICRALDIPAEARPLVELLAEERLARRETEPASGEATFELAHDALLRQWTLLNDSLSDETRLIATLRGVKRAARDWDHNGRTRFAAMHRGARLEEAEHIYTRPELLALLDATDRAYLLFCREKEKAAAHAHETQQGADAELERKKSKQLTDQAQRARRVAWVASIVVALALSAAAVAGWRWRAALHGERLAEAQRNRAEKALAIATDATRRLVADLSGRMKNTAGGQASLIADIIKSAGAWQEELPADAYSKELRRSQSVALNQLAETRLAMGDASGALAAARRSVALMEHLSNADPGNAGWRRDLSVSYEKLGDAQVAQGDLAGALKSYQSDLAIAERLSASGQGDAQLQWDVSVSHEKLGDAQLAKGDVAAALQSYRTDLAIRESLAASHPADAAWRRDLAVSYERVGAALAKQNDTAGATTAFQGALTIYQTLARANSGDMQTLIFSVVPRLRLAELDRSKAREHLEAALAILERGAAADLLDEQRRGWLSTIRGEVAALKGLSPAPAGDTRAE